MSSVRDAASPLHQTASGPPPPTGEENDRRAVQADDAQTCEVSTTPTSTAVQCVAAAATT